MEKKESHFPGNVSHEFVFQHNWLYHVFEHNHSDFEYGYRKLFGHINSGAEQ